MFSIIESSYQNLLWTRKTDEPAEEEVFELDELKVIVDLHPIGGYRGKIGALSIHHTDDKVFTDWSDDNLQTLAKLVCMILYIQNQNHVSNTLIFGQQDNNAKFKFSLISYPKCNLIEKIQGLIHVIFGSPVLKTSEAQQIAEFYREKFNDNTFDDIPELEGELREGKPDAFCRSNVIEEQRITDLSLDNQSYHILHDKWPKGASATDPHLLIVPEGDSGHCDGMQVSQDKRFNMLKIAQKAMQIFLTEKFSTLLFLERNGKKLQGVQHKHCHVIGIKDFPNNFLDKLLVLIRQICTPALVNLKDRVQHYSRCDWLEPFSEPISEV